MDKQKNVPLELRAPITVPELLKLMERNQQLEHLYTRCSDCYGDMLPSVQVILNKIKGGA